MSAKQFCLDCHCELTPVDEGRFASCPDCGFTLYDADTLQLIAETRAEFERAKQAYWPEPVPEYSQYLLDQQKGKP